MMMAQNNSGWAFFETAFRRGIPAPARVAARHRVIGVDEFAVPKSALPFFYLNCTINCLLKSDIATDSRPSLSTIVGHSKRAKF